MRIGMWVSGFPVTSETFIFNQVISLLTKGHDVEVELNLLQSS